MSALILRSELAAVAATNAPVRLRFVDSTTGFALRPEVVSTQDILTGAKQEWLVARSDSLQPADIALPAGRHGISAEAKGYKPMVGQFDLGLDQKYAISIYFDPVDDPVELRAENIAARQRDGATLFQGFVADEATGGPLAGVQIRSEPSGVAAQTDARGYFQIYVPLQSDNEGEAQAASLIFEKSGYGTLERQNLELWSRGDWTYRVKLIPGGAGEIVDENVERRREPRGQRSNVPPGGLHPQPAAVATGATVQEPPPIPQLTLPANATIRVPRNIRVLKSDGTNIDYVTLDYYCKHVLPSEWIASWGSIVGGSNSLNAGAVALRSYAIAKINAASGTSAYDICATTACQVYGTTTSANTDNACNFTANSVVISGGVIASAEYSAENNSTGFGCGDSWTQPTGGCIFDPVCAGETRAGHGRGMCQWGTAKWATGRKMTGNVTGVTTPNGYPLRDWIWIVQHYYPTLTLVKGTPLVIGDDVKAMTVVNVNICPDGGITNGVNCTLLAALPAATTGVIVDGPLVITNDLKGFTWYKVQWNDAGSTLGWAKENYLERIFPVPATPTNLTALASATNQINLNWSDASDVETGGKIERAISAGGPWTQLGTVGANVASFADRNLDPGSTWFYRVRSYNAGGNSSYSSVASATTPNTAPILPPIGLQNIVEGQTLVISNAASASDFVQLLSDVQNFRTDETNAVPLFRNPRFSGSTSTNLNAIPDLAVVTDVFPTNGHGTGLVLRVNCAFTNLANPWLRLTTAGAASWPSPVVDYTKKLRFDIYSDRAIQVALGCRETVTPGGTPIGTDGGTSGNIEWVGVTNVVGGVPQPSRSIAASNWTTLTFDFPTEAVRNFSGGDGILTTASGLGVLEHLAIVPASGTSNLNVYLDNFAVLVPRVLTYSLGGGAPGNATVNATTGVFSWTPTEAQGPATNVVQLIVRDNSSPSLSATQTFAVVVSETNAAPVLAAISNRTVHAGALVNFTNAASDADVPANSWTFSLASGAPATASVGLTSGIFVWQTTDADAGTSNYITTQVTDSGVPPLSDAKSFSIQVQARPMIQVAEIVAGTFALSWSAIDGVNYRVQFKSSLTDPDWIDLVPDVLGRGPVASMSDPANEAQRFYRVVVVP